MKSSSVNGDSQVGLDLLAKTSLECRFQFDEAILYVLLQRLDAANTRISKLLAASEQPHALPGSIKD